MKFIYTNTIDQYTNYLKLEKLKLKILKKIFPIIFLIIFLIGCFFWFNHKITNIQIILVSLETLIPAIFFLYFPEIYFSISKNILEFEDSIYILRNDNNSLIYTPIIPISTFENEKAKKEFIELLSKK